MAEAVLDKGYHSRQTLLDLEEMNVRSYASEPDRAGRRHSPPDANAGFRHGLVARIFVWR